MLPYAGTPQFFNWEEQRSATLRAANQTPLIAWRSVVLPRPIEPHLNHQPYGTFASNSVIRQSEPNIPRAAYTNSGLSSEQTLPGLRDILMTESRDSSRGLSFSSTYALPSPCQNRNDEAMRHLPSISHSLFALHPAHSPLDPHASLHDRLPDLSIVEKQPIDCCAWAAHPVSPSSNNNIEGTNHAVARQERPQREASSFLKTISPGNPQSPLSNEDHAYRTPDALFELPGYPQYAPLKLETSTRYLGIESCPKEGTFHLYEDGYRIPTQVDGEEVNPQWGLTKANKARKRPAAAYLDCREKKAKCELGVNGCLQCIKGKRTCRQYVQLLLDLRLVLTLTRASRGLSSSGRDIVLGTFISPHHQHVKLQ
jgi:hypothetical protein